MDGEQDQKNNQQRNRLALPEAPRFHVACAATTAHRCRHAGRTEAIPKKFYAISAHYSVKIQTRRWRSGRRMKRGSDSSPSCVGNGRRRVKDPLLLIAHATSGSTFTASWNLHPETRVGFSFRVCAVISPPWHCAHLPKNIILIIRRSSSCCWIVQGTTEVTTYAYRQTSCCTFCRHTHRSCSLSNVCGRSCGRLWQTAPCLILMSWRRRSFVGADGACSIRISSEAERDSSGSVPL